MWHWCKALFIILNVLEDRGLLRSHFKLTQWTKTSQVYRNFAIFIWEKVRNFKHTGIFLLKLNISRIVLVSFASTPVITHLFRINTKKRKKCTAFLRFVLQRSVLSWTPKNASKFYFKVKPNTSYLFMCKVIALARDEKGGSIASSVYNITKKKMYENFPE